MLAALGCASVPPPRCATPSPETVAQPTPNPSSDDDALLADDAAFEAELELGIADPLEAVNRKTHALNGFLDRWLLNPLARAYGWLLPNPLERAVARVFANLSEPVHLVNQVVQGEGRRAATSGARFVINSTLGLAGLADPAARFGLARHDADFGQTLGKAGVASGPYLVLPLLGPSNPRDLLGSVVDTALHAETWLVPLRVELAVESVDAISQKEEHRVELESIERTALDPYAAIRAGYVMLRRHALSDRTCPKPGVSAVPSRAAP